MPTPRPTAAAARAAPVLVRGAARAVAALAAATLWAVLVASTVAPAQAQPTPGRGYWVEVEGQYVDFSRNDIQKPNDANGDRFSALPFTGERAPALRLSAELPIPWWGTDHRLRLVYAPLSLEGSAVADGPIRFQDATFAAGMPTTLRYRFDTWRATYTVPLGQRDPEQGWAWRIGGTLAIRDAQIRLSQGAAVQTFDNTGLVPLLHLSTVRAFAPGWRFEADLDGAPGPGGSGLWDIGARVRWQASPQWSVAGGLRLLRGGVDNDELYNRVSSNAVTLSASYAF
jgi:hypothetical protein